jgi:hypothetical protein
MDRKTLDQIAMTGSPAERIAARAMTKTDGIPSLAATQKSSERNSLPASANMTRWSYEMAQRDAMSACAFAKDYLANGSK